MSILRIDTPFNIELEFSTAPIIRRISAVLLDMGILLLYMLIVYHFVFQKIEFDEKAKALIKLASISLIPFLYFPITEILMNGQTPGKRLIGIKVMDKEGNEPTISQYLLRWLLGFGNYSVFLLPIIVEESNSAASLLLVILVYFIFVGVLYFIDFLFAAISAKNQRLADIAAGTVVIDVKKKMSFTETIYQEIDHEHTIAKYPQVMKLTDKDINGIRNLLHKRGNKKDDWEYRALIVQKICTALNITSNELDDTSFLEQLLRDYNYLTQRK